MTRNTLIYILIGFILSTVSIAQDYGITFLDEAYMPDTSQESVDLATCPPEPLDLYNVTDTLSNYFVGTPAVHQIGFQLPNYEFQPLGLLRGRQVVITFPDGFDLSGISSVSYSDTDEGEDPEIKWIYVHHHSVVVRFKDHLPGPEGSEYAYISIEAITNPTIADDYQVVVKVDNFIGRTIAGPALSDPFTIIPRQPYSLEIIPPGDTTLEIGEGIYFRAVVSDELGNVIDIPVTDWTLDPDFDNIGVLFGSFFRASRPGTGRIKARLGELTAFSGMLTVTPGGVTELKILSAPGRARSGEAFFDDVVVEARDQAGNRLIDYGGMVWFTSDDPQAEITYDEENPYQFTAADSGRKIFAGEQFILKTIGSRTLTVTDGILADEVTIEVYSSGPSSFDYTVPETVRAGDAFILSIYNAADQTGNPYTGIISVSGGESAPDGTLPILSDVAVIGGSGNATLMLPAAGGNELRLSFDSITETITITVYPGPVTFIEPTLLRAQFVGHAFISDPSVTVFDRFRNIKTDMASSGNSITVVSEIGMVEPGVISPEDFVDGIADLSGYSYSGNPGAVIVKFTLENGAPEISKTVLIMANGLVALFGKDDKIPAWMPQTWSFEANGQIMNAGELTPVDYQITAGFADVSAAQPHIVINNELCLPPPNSSNGCYFRMEQEADLDVDEYAYEFSVVATYEYFNESITAIWTFATTIDVIAYTPISFDPSEFPDTIRTSTNAWSFPVLVNNENQYTQPARFIVTLDIANSVAQFAFGMGGPITYQWPLQQPLTITGYLAEHIPPGTYTYLLKYGVSFHETDYHASVGLVKVDTLSATIEVIAGPDIAFDSLSVNPRPLKAGVSTSLSFVLEPIGSDNIVIDGQTSTLTLFNGGMSVSGRFIQDTYPLAAGPNTLTTSSIYIPESWAGKTVLATVHISASDGDGSPIIKEYNFSLPVSLSPAGIVQILSLTNNAINSPFVNSGQQFSIIGQIVNHSDEILPGSITVRLVSDGESSLPVTIVVAPIPAGDTVDVMFPVIAATQPNPSEIFTMQLVSLPEGVTVLSAADNQAAAVIQLPARLKITAGVIGFPGSPVTFGFGQHFAIEAGYVNQGQAAVDGGSLALLYTGPGEFGLDFPSIRSLDSAAVWNLTAPEADISSSFVIAWQDIPIDRNSGLSASIVGDSAKIAFVVESPLVSLHIQGENFSTRPLERGKTGRLFDLALNVFTNDTRNYVGLKEMIVEISDKDGRLLDPGVIIAESNFYLDDAPVAIVTIDNKRMVYAFDNVIASAETTERMEYRMRPQENAGVDYFRLLIDFDNIIARVVSGPQVGQQVPVTGTVDQAFEINAPQSIIPSEFAASFKNYPNPFNPELESTEIRYNLPRASDVNIYIYTATGERVRYMHFDAGANGGLEGLNDGIVWDGRNGNGDVVLNGVYIAYIEAVVDNLTATVKMAVVK